MTVSSASSDNLELSFSGRSSFAEIRAEQEKVAQCRPLVDALEALPFPAFVFNEQRQLLHANSMAMREVEAYSLDSILGLRLGEILGCSHAVGSRGGCGSDSVCPNCASTQTILGALAGRVTESRAELTLDLLGVRHRQTYRLRATPLTLGQNKFALLGLTRLGEP